MDILNKQIKIGKTVVTVKGLLILFIIIILLIGVIGMFVSEPSASTNTCRVCGRTFEAGDAGGNYRNIAKTHMCNNCYSNYLWAQDALGQ